MRDSTSPSASLGATSPLPLADDVASGGSGGVFRLPPGDLPVDENGVALTSVLDLPPWRSACYYAAYQRHDPVRRHDPLSQAESTFPSTKNRVQALPVRDLGDLTAGGQFLLLELDTDRHVAVLPVSSQDATAWFESSDGDLALRVGNFGSAPIPGGAPILVWAVGTTPRLASEEVWRVALGDPELGRYARRRSQKTYPEPFEYLGWCSWEQYKLDISEGVLLDAIDGIERSGLPIRYLLVDDGYLSQRDQQLVSFDPAPETFPGGWEPVIARRREDAIRWFGRWVNFNGYWEGIAVENDLPPGVQAHLERFGDRLQPGAGIDSSRAYFEALIAGARDEGFDFVKVDDQAESISNYRGGVSPVARTHEKSRALETATSDVTGLISCMAHSSIRLFTGAESAVLRCSEDYAAGDAWWAKCHLHNSFANTLWLGPVFWGDHDMFHSSDPVAAQAMAISHAMSGGPVYLSDDPVDFDEATVSPLCWKDGRLLRPLAPAGPVSASTYVDPFEEGRPLIVTAPLANGAAAVAAFNLTDPTVPITARWGIEAYREAFDGIEGGAAPTSADVVVYDWSTGEARLLDSEVVAELEGFEHRLWIVCPVRDGWAVIGRPDKYLSPAGVEIVEAGPGRCRLRGIEEGPVLVWSREAVDLGSAEGMITPLRDDLWEVRFSSPVAVIDLRTAPTA